MHFSLLNVTSIPRMSWLYRAGVVNCGCVERISESELEGDSLALNNIFVAFPSVVRKLASAGSLWHWTDPSWLLL